MFGKRKRGLRRPKQEKEFIKILKIRRPEGRVRKDLEGRHQRNGKTGVAGSWVLITDH
jgi:hypothetical protein